MRIASRVLLGLKQRVKVPEAALHKVIGRHFIKAHFNEDLPELASHLQSSIALPPS